MTLLHTGLLNEAFRLFEREKVSPHRIVRQTELFR